jgi:hypothetical protein
MHLSDLPATPQLRWPKFDYAICTCQKKNVGRTAVPQLTRGILVGQFFARNWHFLQKRG